jgi:hypothetical protein
MLAQIRIDQRHTKANGGPDSAVVFSVRFVRANQTDILYDRCTRWETRFSTQLMETSCFSMLRS